jgi:hypothetical protein
VPEEIRVHGACQGCQIFLGAVNQNGEKYTKMDTNLPNGIKIGIPICLTYNIQNGHKIYEHFPFQGPSKISQIGIFGMKIYHLATLVPAVARHWKKLFSKILS